MIVSQRNYAFTIRDVKVLLSLGASVYTPDSGWSVLLLSILTGHNTDTSEDVKMLLEAGADPNIKSVYGITPLMAAAFCSKYENDTLRVLLDAGANVNQQDNDGNTALMYAAKYTNLYSTEDTIQYLLTSGADVNLQDKNGWTALMYAIRYSQTSSTTNTVQMLIDADSDVNHSSGLFDDITPMKLLDLYPYSTSDDIIQMLLDAGANVDYSSIHDDSDEEDDSPGYSTPPMTEDEADFVLEQWNKKLPKDIGGIIHIMSGY